MNRGYTGREYLEKVLELRNAVDDICLTTDIIVGFPGESEDDFRDTLEMVEACRFDSAFTFLYNAREETAAARMLDDVPSEIKQERFERLLDLTGRLTAASLSGEVGRERLAIVYGPSRKDPRRWTARLRLLPTRLSWTATSWARLGSRSRPLSQTIQERGSPAPRYSTRKRRIRATPRFR